MQGSLPTQMQQPDLPHDVRGLIPYRASWTDHIWLIGAILALLALAAAAFFAYRRWRSRRVAPVVPTEPFAVRARRRIRELTPQPPFDDRAQQRQYYFELSLFLREVLEHCTQIAATDMTHAELRRALESDARGIRDSGEVLRFLHRADLVKYADQEALLREAEADHALCRKWVEDFLLLCEPAPERKEAP